MPVVFRAGATNIFARFPRTRFSLDVVKPIDQVFDFRLGLEYRHAPNLHVRAGYGITQPELERTFKRSDSDNAPERAQSWSVGAGYAMRKMTLDYALQNWDLFGLTHAVSLLFPF
jgi:hypothetical protein